MRNVFDHFNDALVFGADSAGGINDVDDDINAFERVANFVMKIGDEFVRRGFEKPRRVHENNLAFGPVDDAVVGVARGLRLRRDDGDFGADERVEQRGFADVGAADEHGEAGFESGRLSHGAQFSRRIMSAEP